MHDNYSKLKSDRPPPYSEACSVPSTSSPTAPASASGPVPVLVPGPGPRPGPGVRPTPISLYNQNLRKNLAKICGCGPKTWTKIIATIQIIAFGISFVWRFAAVCNSIGNDENNLSRSNGTHTQLEDDEEEIVFNLFNEYNGNPINQAMETLIGLSFGCILFAGAHYGKPVLILIWMVMQGFIIGIFGIFVLSFIFLLCLGGGLLAVFFIIVFLIPTGISVFCFYVVSRHRRELIKQRQLETHEHQTIIFHSVTLNQ